MSKSSSQVERHGSAGWKSPSLRKEVHGNRSCMLKIGERLMRAGSEGNLLDKPIKTRSQIFSDGSQQGSKGHAQLPGLQDKPKCTGTNFSKDFGTLPSKLSHSTNLTASSSSIEHLTKKRERTNINLSTVDPVPSSPNTLPRNFTLVGATCKGKQQNSHIIQKLGLEKKKDVFPGHLKQKYPHHAAVIIGHGESIKQISKEVLYGSHSPIHSKYSSGRNTLHSLQGSMSPPMVRSMPSSPSRLAYGGGGFLGKIGMVDPGSTTIPHERQPGRGRSSTMFSSSSAILERRDVKPDGDMSKSSGLVLRGEGGSHYPEYYRSASVEVGRGHHSISSYCSSPPMLTGGTAEVGVPGIPGGLQQYRASIKPLMVHGESIQNHSNSLRRQKNRKYGDNQIHLLGYKSPPPSPHNKGNEVRMFNGQVIGGASQVSPQSMSPIHRSLERNSSGLTVDVINRRGSSSSTSSVFLDNPLGQPETLFPAHITACNVQSERMRAMEEQIASLAGLVHHALSMKSDVLGQKDIISQSPEDKLLSNRLEALSDSKTPAALTESFSPTPLALGVAPFDGGLRHNLMSVKRNICELRLKLSQLKCLQLSNMESVSSMLRMAGPELVMLMCEKLAQFGDEAYRQRAEMAEDRIRYLTSEEKILTQLSELEDFVECLENSSSVHSQPSFTLRDVEEGAVSLRRLGEALAVLKGEFPVLQAKMRSVLRLEVEAVRFLKEEPQMMDSMLKRVKVLTESFSSLRRLVSDLAPSARSVQVESLKVHNQETATTKSTRSSPKPQPQHSVKAPPPRSQVEASSGASASPSRMKSTVTSNQHNSSPTTTSHGLDLISVVKNTHRPTPEGSVCVDIRSVNQSSTSQDPQQESNDPSHSQSVHLQETPNTDPKSVVDVLEYTASGTKSPSASTSQQNTPVELIHGADISETQKDTTLKQSVDVDSRERRSSNTDVADPPPAVCPPAESSRRPQAEKPRRSIDKRQASKFPPPPQSVSSLFRSGEPIIITSRETDGIQVSKEISNIIHLPSGNGKTPPPITKMCPSDMAKCGQRFTLQFEHPNVSSFKAQIPGVVTALHRDKMTSSLAKMEVQQVPSLNCTSVAKVWTGERELLTLPAKQTEDILVMNVPDQCEDEAVGHILSSAVAENLVIPLKEQNLKQTNAFIKKPLDEKANGMLVSCLQNENVHEERWIQLSPRLGPKQLWSSAHEHETSPSVPKPFSLLPDVTYGASSTQQEQDAALQGSRDQPAWREGGSLIFTATDDRAAPLSPQTPECIHKTPHTHISSQFGKEDPGNMMDFEGSYCGFQDNDESHEDSVIVFMEDPEPFYVPLSTIFECEEEDEEFLSPNRTLEEEPDVKLKSHTGPDSDILGDMKTSPPSASFCDSVSKIQGQDQTNKNMKTCSKKKISIKFPKNKLAALSQVIRTGTNKKGKKVSKIVARDKEQKAGNRPVTESKQTNEVSQQFLPDNSSDRDITAGTSLSKSYPRVEELCKNTLESMNSLEESIKQLELSVESINPSSDGAQLKGRVKENNGRSPSKTAASQTVKSKRVRPQPLLSSTSQQSSNTSAEQPHNKLQHATCGSPEGRAEVLQQSSKSSIGPR
ncbi:sickle tail protein isoform X4 [Poecilia reticulata]|uniref:sickle tail protein isoform X4 n=1 Tax=Poecilia reticulata TaxID=8081 RepID=UPI0007EA3E5C|nr:PREDICTED: sickle tail protein-like isoform X4 [Poecilia reticulata]